MKKLLIGLMLVSFMVSAETKEVKEEVGRYKIEVTTYVSCLLYTSPSPRDLSTSRMPSSA